MSKHAITLGKIIDGPALRLDVAGLIDTRMLIQANSGGGKSWLLRLIAERSAKDFPIVVFDVEGEFASLREKLDLVLVGERGELPAEPRAAGVLARRLMELRVSAVLDLYELKMHDRRRFVRLFFESLMELPKKLWQPTLFLLDEAHLFCPEKSAGEAESTGAVIDLASRGGKRGYCLVAATQRLSKFHKDCAAELNNVCIGRTQLDVDVKRALDALGMAKTDRPSLRDLGEETKPAREFFAYGPALSCQGVGRFVTDQVETTHPRGTAKARVKPPGPSRRIKSVVGEMADLAKQADEEIRTLQQAQAEVARLTRELKAAQKVAAKPAQVTAASPAPAVAAATVKVAEAARDKVWKGHVDNLERELRDRTKRLERVRELLGNGKWLDLIKSGVVEATRPLAAQLRKAFGGEVDLALPPRPTMTTLSPPGPARGTAPPAMASADRKTVTPFAAFRSAAAGPVGDVALNPTERALLRAFYWLQDEDANLSKVAFYADRSPSSSTVDRALAKVRKLGLVDGWKITAAGIAAVPVGTGQKPTGSDLVDWLKRHLNPTEQALLDAALSVYPNRSSTTELCELAGRSSNSSTVDRAMARLRSLEALKGVDREGGAKASDVFFQEA